MDHTAEDIRQLRKSRKLTVRELANRIDRSAGFVSQLERGRSKPTMKDIYALAEALDVTVAWFVQNNIATNPKEQGKIVRRNQRRKIETNNLVTEILSPRLGDQVEFMQTTYEPMASTESKNIEHLGIETGLVLSGELEMWLDGEYFYLSPGDSYSVNLNQPHHSQNPSSTEKTVLVWTVTYEK